MKAIDAIRTILKFSDMGMKYLGEMSDAPLLRPGPWGGNHAMWIAGHLTVVEGRLQKMLRGTPNPVEGWKPLFDWGSEPVDDPAAYPPYDEVLRKFKELRGQTHRFLDEVGEKGLDLPTKRPALGVHRIRDGGCRDPYHCRPRVRASGAVEGGSEQPREKSGCLCLRRNFRAY